MTTNKPHDPELRAAIIAEIGRGKAEGREQWAGYGEDALIWHDKTFAYCTWWFKLKIPRATRVIRQELERMERDGLVTADRSQSNNTKWRLVEHDDQ